MDDQPLQARGTYNFDEDFDENTNPFASTKALSNSPPAKSFHLDDLDENINPFVTTKTLASTPPKTMTGSQEMIPERDFDPDSLSDEGSPPSGSGDLDINENTPKKKKSPKKPVSSTRSKLVKPVRRSPAKDPDIELFTAPLPVDAAGDYDKGPKKGSSPKSADIAARDAIALANVCDAEDLSPIGAGPQNDLGIPDDEFKPATDVFNDANSWDILEQFGGGQKATNLTRESLYVRFDPLMKKNSPMVPIPQSREPDVIPEQDETSLMASSQQSDDAEDLLMMHTPPTSKVKHPAARQLQKKLQQPSPRNDLDRIFQLQASKDTPPTGATTRLPASTAPVSNDGIVDVLKYSDADLAKLKMDHQARILSKERDWDKREQELLAEIQQQKETIDKMTLSNEDMQKIVAEYERTVSQVIVDKAKLTSTTEENLQDAIRERNQAVDQLRTMESAFSDLHGRYEKAKNAVETLKANEEELKKCITEYQNKIRKHEQRYQLLKQHAEEKLQSANEEIDKVHKSKNSEIARIQAALKRSELQASSLENSLQQKVQENRELTSICDDLIKQVGGDG